MEQTLLKNWSIGRVDGGKVVVWGEVHNDTKGRFSNGMFIRTSQVLRVDFTSGIVETKNSIYKLDLGGER